MKDLISNFRRLYENGLLIPDEMPLDEMARLLNEQGPSPLIGVEWTVGSKLFKRHIQLADSKPTEAVYVLPDKSGFVIIEKAWKPDNCLLLDAYGKERMRLIAPWQMTGAQLPEGVTFGYPEKGYSNPKTGAPGSYGINGWVGHSKFYFELDYQTGTFLWCVSIRD